MALPCAFSPRTRRPLRRARAHTPRTAFSAAPPWMAPPAAPPPTRSPLSSCARQPARDVELGHASPAASAPLATANPSPATPSTSPPTPNSPAHADYGAISRDSAGGGPSSGAPGGGGGGGGDRGDAGPPAGGGGWPGWRAWLWPAQLVRRYLSLLDRAPLGTKVATSAVLGALSDLLAQAIEARGGGGAAVDWRRVAALAAVGAVLTAPLFHYLYEYLERALPVGGAGARKRARNVAVQLLVDQAVAAPAWLLAFFPLFEVAESGRFDGERILRGLRRDYLPSLRLTWTVFPVLQLLSFTLLPSNMRVLVLNVIDLGYTAGLSLIKHV